MKNPQPVPAGIVTRGCAAVIDAVTVLTLMAGGYVGVAFVRLMFSPQSFSLRQPELLWSTTAFLIISIGYLTVCWAMGGRTAGAWMMGLRVVGTRQRRLTKWPLALVRAVLCVLFAFGLLWSAFDRRRRSLQDIALRTSVVYDWHREPPRGT